MQSSIFQNSLESLYYIYSQLDTTGVLTTPFPNNELFFEDKINDINYSFLRFLDSNTQLEDSSKITLSLKFSNKEYTSIYNIFHDLKLSCILKILEFENNPNLYAKVDNFYKISIEILLREAIRLGVSLKNNSDIIPTEESDADINAEDKIQSQLSQLKPIETTEDLAPILEKDFEIITSSFFNSTGKALSIFASGNIPFFSSLNNFKSDLDDREPVIDPSLGINITNVIPNISIETNENFSKFSNTDIKIPNIRQILENYMHPNWLRLISSQWLKHGNGLSSLNFSFAPTCDETRSIISNDWKGLTWCQQVGFKKLVEEREKYDNLINSKENGDNKDISDNDNSKESSPLKVDGDNNVSENENGGKISNDDSKNAEENENEDEKKDEEQITHNFNNMTDEDKIDLSNILQWDTTKLVSDDEAKIVESNKVQSTVSDLLSDLSQLRQDRIQRQKKHARYNKNILGTGSRIFKPSNEELKLYNKIRRLLTGMIEAKDIKPNDLNIQIDTRIPVLQHTYQGTLPASFAVSNQKATKSKRKR